MNGSFRGEGQSNSKPGNEWAELEKMIDEWMPHVVPEWKGKPLSSIGRLVRQLWATAEAAKQTDPGEAAQDERPSRSGGQSPRRRERTQRANVQDEDISFGEPSYRHSVRASREHADEQRDAYGRRVRTKPLFRVETAETDRFVKVRILIPPHVDPRKIQLFVNGSMLLVEGPLGNRQTIGLPSPVGAKGGRAEFKQAAIHIRLPKRGRERYRELYVHFP